MRKWISTVFVVCVFVLGLSCFSPSAFGQAKPIEITYWAFGSEGSAKADTGELWSDWYGKKLDAFHASLAATREGGMLTGEEQLRERVVGGLEMPTDRLSSSSSRSAAAR